MPLQISSEKFIRAERKNRLADSELMARCKLLDKQTVRINYEIDREKRIISREFNNVIKTSGASDLGLPPKGNKVKDFEKCPTYMQCFKLSNKRLTEWRECEKQLNKFIANYDLKIVKKERKKGIKKQKDAYNAIHPKHFNDFDEDDMFLDEEDKSVKILEKCFPLSVLKDNPREENDKFDVKISEAEIIEKYKSMICSNTESFTCYNYGKNKLRSKSSPTLSTELNQPQTGNIKRTRPHTAQPRVRPLSGQSSLPTRPSSANIHKDNESKFLITKDNIYIKIGQSFEKLLESRPADKPVMVNNYLNTVMLPNKETSEQTPQADNETSIECVSTLCPVQESNEDDEDGTNNDATDVSQISKYKEKLDSQGAIGNGISSEIRNDLAMKFQTRLKQKLLLARGSRTMTGCRTSQQQMKKRVTPDFSLVVESVVRRMRHGSESNCSTMSMPISRTGSFVSNHRPSVSLGIHPDIKEISRGQSKLVSEVSVEKPVAVNKLVSVANVVKAAMTFSKAARKRALCKMQEENSADSQEIILQERLRILQSRQQVLNTVANQWNLDQTASIEQTK